MPPEKFSPSSKIYVSDSAISRAGRGVFAATDIKKGELIERSPVVTIPGRFDRFLMKRTELRNYYYQWGEGRKQVAICLGFGSLYNHSYRPNAAYQKMIEGGYMDFTAREDIRKDEEITINYNGYPDDKSKLWIASVPPSQM